MPSPISLGTVQGRVRLPLWSSCTLAAALLPFACCNFPSCPASPAPSGARRKTPGAFPTIHWLQWIQCSPLEKDLADSSINSLKKVSGITAHQTFLTIRYQHPHYNRNLLSKIGKNAFISELIDELRKCIPVELENVGNSQRIRSCLQ